MGRGRGADYYTPQQISKKFLGIVILGQIKGEEYFGLDVRNQWASWPCPSPNAKLGAWLLVTLVWSCCNYESSDESGSHTSSEDENQIAEPPKWLPTMWLHHVISLTQATSEKGPTCNKPHRYQTRALYKFSQSPGSDRIGESPQKTFSHSPWKTTQTTTILLDLDQFFIRTSIPGTIPRKKAASRLTASGILFHFLTVITWTLTAGHNLWEA